MRAVSDEMVLTLSAAGTADDVAARVSALLKTGLKQAVRCCFLSRWMATPVAPSYRIRSALCLHIEHGHVLLIPCQ